MNNGNRPTMHRRMLVSSLSDGMSNKVNILLLIGSRNYALRACFCMLQLQCEYGVEQNHKFCICFCF
jgi:hypothetical protein